MIPEGADIFSADLSAADQPSESFKLDLEREFISERIDGIDAVRQAVFKILNTERYRYPIYSWDYGVKLDGLFGEPFDYVCAELQRRIAEALECDDRIAGVEGFNFTRKKGGVIFVEFIVRSVYGTFESYLNYRNGGGAVV